MLRIRLTFSSLCLSCSRIGLLSSGLGRSDRGCLCSLRSAEAPGDGSSGKPGPVMGMLGFVGV